ncbi:MAG: LytTR family DNA-binding domain-containing protein [Eubacterium sp.]|nr:LytTR family DNA-binding domain-containing protein [Eubacterium sp.]
MNYKIAVCDDENIIIDDIISKLLDRSNEYEIVRCNSGNELLKIPADYNILFLDIEMPGISGMETAFQLREKKYDGIIIFLTSHIEFMPDAFKVKAFRFLNKPIEIEKFNEAFSAAEKEIINTEHILIKERDKSVYIKLTDIVYLEAYGDGTYIYDKNKRVYDTDKAMKYWKEQIGSEHFYQISKSNIVSLLYIADYSKDGTITVKPYLKKLTLSRRNAAAFKAVFFDFIKKNARAM